MAYVQETDLTINCVTADCCWTDEKHNSYIVATDLQTHQAACDTNHHCVRFEGYALDPARLLPRCLKVSEFGLLNSVRSA